MMPTQEHLLNVNISMVCHGLMAHHLLMSNYKMSKETETSARTNKATAY